MKKKNGTTVAEKIVILHINGVPEEKKSTIQRKYPNALVKPVHIDEALNEAVEYKKKVNHLFYTPEVGEGQAKDIAGYWPGCTIVAMPE